MLSNVPLAMAAGRSVVAALVALLAVVACGGSALTPTAASTPSPASSPTLAPASPEATSTPLSPSPSAAQNVPVVPACNPGRYPGTGYKPALIFIGCATSADNLDHLTWTSWTSTFATGTAEHNLNNCRPSCAQGTYSHYAVVVTLSNPGAVNGKLVFRKIVVSANSAEGSETVTSGSWGWVPS